MELKQLEFFLKASECGSLNKAAEALMMSQAHVSKVIASLEKELGYKLLERTSRGIILTEKGKHVEQYAKHILKHVDIIEGLNQKYQQEYLTVSSYQSNMVAHLLVELYKEDSEVRIKYSEGTVEEITDDVSQGISELGLIYISEKQLRAFRHIIAHKRLKFIPLATKEACIYVGPNHPLYMEETILVDELKNLKFVRGTHDFFSMEHHLEHVSLGGISSEPLNHFIYTNSDHLTVDMLLYTDICSFGINVICKKYEDYPIKALKIRDSEPFFVVGYVCQEEHELSYLAEIFIDKFQKML